MKKETELLIGAETLLNYQQAQDNVKVGADYIVSPLLIKGANEL